MSTHIKKLSRKIIFYSHIMESHKKFIGTYKSPYNTTP
ncbi:hypothetical protein [Xenorhabdus sp. BG5]|nr:hypothetical protein [Xenorhabdus sp. BG5]